MPGRLGGREEVRRPSNPGPERPRARRWRTGRPRGRASTIRRVVPGVPGGGERPRMVRSGLRRPPGQCPVLHTPRRSIARPPGPPAQIGPGVT
jgi:hypothetical protein